MEIIYVDKKTRGPRFDPRGTAHMIFLAFEIV